MSFNGPLFLNGEFWRFKVLETGQYMKTDRELNGLYEVRYKGERFVVARLDQNTEPRKLYFR